jgi:hypothetical protein
VISVALFPPEQPMVMSQQLASAHQHKRALEVSHTLLAIERQAVAELVADPPGQDF